MHLPNLFGLQSRRRSLGTSPMHFPNLVEYLNRRDFGPSMKVTWRHEEDTEKTHPGRDLPWNGLSCLSVVSYVLSFRYEGDIDLIHIMTKLDELSWRIDKNYLREDPEIAETSFAETFVNKFMPKVKKFFGFPRGNENLSGFINFLLQILNSELDHFQLERYAPLREGMRSLQKELTFLLAVLGDIPFRYNEMEEVKNILTEFKIVVNAAGSFIYSCVFSTRPILMGQFYVDINDLFVRVFKLYEKIKSHCIRFSEFGHMCANLRNTDAADSLFIVSSLLENLENYTTFYPDLICDIKGHIKGLHDELVSARSFLKDMNMQHETDFQELKEQIVKVRDIAYEAEYLINSFLSENFPVWYLAVRLPAVLRKFKGIGNGFEEIRTLCGIKIKILKLEEVLTVEVPSRAEIPNPAVMGNDIIGFENKIIEILDELTGGSLNLRIISIFGMPGLGKTTLANKLYNDCLLSNRFDQCAWCVVSQAYSKQRLLIDILMSLRSMHDKNKVLHTDEESLISEFYQSLKGRRYLIVMDDVWDSHVFDDLKRYFPNDRNGSRILVTTRIRDVCPTNSIIHTLSLMPEDQCWQLLEKKVFHNDPCPPQLLKVGKRIAVKCNGLPLAVVVTAGVLKNIGKEESAWEKVEQRLNTHTSNYMTTLELSYTHLPDHLKLCFLCFGIFPEDAKVPVRKLIWLWISEGFIRKDEGKNREHIAREYLKNLIDRSLVLVAKKRSTGGVKACSIHDLVRTMCIERAQKENFLTIVNSGCMSTDNHHRLCVLPTTLAHIRPFSLCCRSFFGHLSDPSSCLPQIKHLRTMELVAHCSGSIYYKLKKVDLLVHLRYLIVDIMPEPILGNLVNLEVLVVNTKFDVVDVPPILLKMDKLRHLHVKLQAKFPDDCDNFKPNNLHSLSVLSIRSSNAYEILASSPHLHKLKCMCPSQLPDFRFLTELESLKIVARDTLRSLINNTEINFPLTIKKLSLSGTRLPWERMLVLGSLPKLQVLKLLCNSFEGKKWKTRDSNFHELKFLNMEDIKIEQWIVSSEHFPRLEHLVLRKCEELMMIPTELGDIPTLSIIEVQNCRYEASTSASRIEQEQRDNGNEELKVIITGHK